jgi:hypothetical protein
MIFEKYLKERNIKVIKKNKPTNLDPKNFEK